MKAVLKYPSSDTNPNPTSFDYVYFMPYMWSPAVGFGNAVNSITSVGSLDNAKTVIIDAFKSLEGATGGMSTTKEDFIKSLKHILLDGKTLRIGLPFTVSQVSSISHQLSWTPGDAANAAFIQHAASAITSAVDMDIKGMGRNLLQAGEAKVRDWVLDAMEKGPIKIGNFGLAVYQPQRQMFSGVSPLTFRFEWELVPRNKEESETIIDIIDSFRFLSYPSRIGGGGTSISKTAIRQPCLWRILFPRGDSSSSKFDNLIAGENSFLCVIDSIDFAIGQSSDSSKMVFRFEDDMPNSIKISIGMKEYFNPMDGIDRFGNSVAKKFNNISLKTLDELNEALQTPTPNPK